MNSSIRSLAAAALLSTLALLAGCGGGGAKDPYSSTPTPPLVVSPSTLNIYAGVPAVVTINSGVGPFQVFTSDAVVLPVTQVVSGAAITLTASSVDAQKAVTLTVRDAAGQSAAVAVAVLPSALLSEFAITPTSNTTCAGVPDTVINKAAICSGESGLAAITVRSAGTAVLANRQIRFDVVQGAFNFVVDQAGTTLAKTLTVLTDQNGRANVAIRTDAAAASQAALIRATDVASGNRVDGSFTIVQAVDGKGVLTVVPPSRTVTGYFQNECAGAQVDYVIYGGLAPYTITNAGTTQISLIANGVSSPTSVVVPQAGGRFTVLAGYSGSCVGFDAQIVITDASGRAITATYTAKPGSQARAETVIAPVNLSVKANAGGPAVGYCTGTYLFTIATGYGSVNWSLSVPTTKATLLPDPTSAAVKLTDPPYAPGGGLAAGETITIIAVDTQHKMVTATLSCTP